MSDFTQQLDEMKDCTVVTNDYLERVNKALDELKRVRAVNAELLEALKEIAKGEGAFSLDPLTFANNTIENMKEIAQAISVAAEGES